LMLAAGNGHTEIVVQLLNKGADVNAESPDGATALIIAAENGHTKIAAELLDQGADVNAESDGYTALMLAAKRGHAETVLALLSRNDVDWQIVQDQLRHPTLRNLNKEVSVLLAITLPEGELRNLIITSFNQRNPNDAIQQENWAGPEIQTLKDLKSWHVRYLTDSGVPQDEVKISANRRFFDLLNHQDARQEALARNDLVAGLVSKSASLAADFERIATNFPEIEDQKALDDVRGLSPEDLYKLTTKIIDKSKAENDGVPTLRASSLVALLRNFEIPTTTMHRDSAATIAKPIVTPQKGGHFVIS